MEPVEETQLLQYEDFEMKLIMRGNDRLKVGQVAEKDQNTYVVDIVTVDDSLVRQVEVGRDNGLPRGPLGSKR